MVTLLKLLYSPYSTKLGCRPTEGNPHFSCHLISALPFDTIDHSILLARLRSMYGVDGSALMWLESYLSQRVQYVKFGHDVSSTPQLKTGAPQGSVLGPILFTSFISPIQFVTSQFNVDQQQYADDTQVFISLSKGNSPDRASRLGNCTCTSHFLVLPQWSCFKSRKVLRPSSLAPILAINHLITSPRLTLMVRPFPYPTVSSYWALPLIHL